MRDWGAVADQVEEIYERIAARRHDPRGNPELRRRIARRREIHVDLHMHTDHSSDCATPVETLLATAREVGLGAIAITDHNEISGALAARELADEFGVKVIVAEEVKTAEQGEVIGLFLTEKIERGMTMAETIAEIRRQGGLVYVPHPFDRLHSVPDYEHLLDIVEEIDILEVFNPRVALTAFNEEAERFAAKYRIVPGAGSDSHVAQGLGSVMIRVHDFDGAGGVPRGDARRRHRPQAEEPDLRAGAEAAADRRRARRQAAQRRSRGPREGGQALMQGGAAEGGRAVPSKKSERLGCDRGEPGGPSLPTTDDEIQEKYLERAIRELNQLTHRLQECSHCPRGNLMPVLGSGHPQADVMLLKYAPTAAEIEEGVAFYGRSGNALMKSFKRLGIDPLAVYGTLCVKCPVSDPALAAGECVERVVEEIAIVQPRCIVVMGERALEALNELEVPLARELEPTLGEIQALTPTIDALYVPDIDESLDSEELEARVLGGVPRARRLVRRAAARTDAGPPRRGRGSTTASTSRRARPSRCVGGARGAARGRRGSETDLGAADLDLVAVGVLDPRQEDLGVERRARQRPRAVRRPRSSR